MDTLVSYLRVRLGDAIVGLPATAVREIVRAVAITPLAGAPPIVEGAVNVRGQLVPVVDVRRRLGIASKPLDPSEFLVLLDAGGRTLAMRADDVDDLVEIDASTVAPSAALSPALRGMAGLAPGADGVLAIHDPAAFVSAAEAEAIADALASALDTAIPPGR